MFRLRVLLFATVPLLVSFPALASNFAVGTCKPRLTSFSSISAAVAGVPPGSTIQVCPGVYPEQIVISQPLTLQGIASGGQDQVVIAVPSTLTPLSANVVSMFGEPVAAQVLIQSPGAVNITNVIVDGTGGDQACLTSNVWVAGIFYASDSSGEVDRVRISGQTDEGCGVGIWAENTSTSNRTVNIHDSSIHDVDGAGIFVGSGPSPTLTAIIRENFISVPLGSEGVEVNSVNGVVARNNVTDTLAGIFDFAPAVRVSNNTVTNTTFGILLLLGGTAESNDVSNSVYGIYLAADGAVVQSNHITLAPNAGIELSCHIGTVSHNTINDAAVGLDQVPSGFHGSNTFANTGFISVDGCTAAPLVASAARVQSLTAAQSGTSSPQGWRTPANPFGAKK
jgi:Periplasmic copper-binding protein (NosD)